MMVYLVQNHVLKQCANKIVDLLMVVQYFIGNQSNFSISIICFFFVLFKLRFRLIKDYLVEFNQLAMSAANGPACHDMMNRVMTKDNIGLVALLETKDDIYSHTFSNGRSFLFKLFNFRVFFLSQAFYHLIINNCYLSVQHIFIGIPSIVMLKLFKL